MLSPAVEGLEDRRLLSSLNGGQWTYPVRVTYSFMPDGTSIGGVPSNLYQKLNTVAPTAAWQQAFQKAAAIWQQVAGINLALVSDNGAPVGGAGYQQGDPRFGDIRIGGTAMSPAYLAYSFLPPPANGGTDAGDIVINTSASWQVNNDYDLQTVALHEFGHALGMGHSLVVQADMFANYVWMKQSLNADDISGIQQVYGPVPADPSANSTMSAAIDLTPLMVNSQIAMSGGYVTGTSGCEWYKVTVPGPITNPPTIVPMTVKMQSTDLSSLAPRLAVYNSAGVALSQALDANKYGSTVTLTIPNASPGQVYYIRATAANAGAGSNGAFGILVNFTNNPQAPIAPPNTQVAATPDRGGWMAQSTPRGPAAHGHAHGMPKRLAPHRRTDDDQLDIKLGGGRRAVAHALKASPLFQARPQGLRGAGRGPMAIKRRGW